MWIWAATAWATTYSVTPTSYPSLTDALDLAVAGDTVEVGAGTYTVTAAVEENVEVVGTGVVLFVPASGGVPMLEFRKGGALRDVLTRYADGGGRFEELVIEDAGHTPYVEKPEAFAAAFHPHLRG